MNPKRGRKKRAARSTMRGRFERRLLSMIGLTGVNQYPCEPVTDARRSLMAFRLIDDALSFAVADTSCARTICVPFNTIPPHQ
jgi:hypothetical protein